MAFIESPIFPFIEDLAYGSMGGPRYMTEVIGTHGGQEQRNSKWRNNLQMYEVGLENRNGTATRTLLAFFRAVAKGQTYGFRFRDFLPGESTGTDELLGTGDSTTTIYQLRKAYVYADEDATYRKIVKPISGSVTCALDGSNTTDFTLDYTTGLVTFTSAPGDGVLVTSSFQFHVPVRFMVDRLPITKVNIDAYSWASIQLYETRDIAA